ncbi:hypothetical protein ACFWBS_57930 [Streptomyces mirabilis]|uniref:hypothetical protein n=1 Tax=Streptomyces mirabilis TaxID=68239 RepID=UPI00365B5992
MAGRNRRGRAWGELRAQTQQARELAEFLRRLVDQHGFTVRRLQEVMSYGKSTISSNLNGKVPQEQFVLDLVEAVVREPRMKQHVLAEARRLWKAADKPPAPTGVAAGPTSALALAHKTNEQLVTVYERNRDLERERTGAHQLVLVLVRLVGHLQDQVDELGHRPDAAAELDAVHEQLRVAKQELERARRAREEAELLADRAQQRATALEEELARARQVMPQNDVSVAVDFATAQLPPELQEESILADVDRALRTAEGFLQEGAERRAQIADGIGRPRPGSGTAGEGWQVVALLVGRTLGVVLMMVGTAIHYGLSTWVTKRDVVLGFPDLLVLFGIALLVDPWDIVWNTLRPLFLRLTHDSDEPVVWDLTIPDVLTRALRVPWGAAAAAAAALSLATIYWWPMWILIATIPAALATMAYAIAGRNRHIVQLVAPLFTGIAQLLPKPLPASTTAPADSSPPGTR